MSVENVGKFYEAVSQDKAMQQKFIDLSRKYKSDTVDEARVDSIVEQDVVPLAKQMGYEFTLDDLRAYGEQARQLHQGAELSEEEMKAVAGGVFVCVFIGAGDKTDFSRSPLAFCVLVGADCEQNLCCVIGVTTETK